ncbi:serine hydrolase domain-containing protein [Mucilaginibacter boryungensis]|uniref:Serine hydrolase n=1 Tax=Mucilaginibacter boryungensis TaxID=768480 RepID=A0ABR9XFT3_9SPHI|nr:serine hydrolase domain-containing protein [Mucilaginibacter boryungensis]MBE9666242.1 serine hydrolase [Mucilaginibacter boryungensis]
MNKTALLLFLWVVAFSTSSGQSLPDSIQKKVDALFKKWSNPAKPGCTVGIIRNDSLIYAKGFGLANVELQIPNTPGSIYYMCSVSKQFTGYAIALLVQQGKIDPAADIHTYLPWMGDLGAKVTVQQLLNHTSGIRDDINLSEIIGLPVSGMLTDDVALEILRKQRSLNFVPGEKYTYSNSNYVLLATIVKAVTGQPFKDFVDQQIFKPLGMLHSRFVDNPDDVIVNRALSYSPNNKREFSNSLQNVYTMGDGGLFTNIPDMAKWAANYYSPTNQQVIKLMTERGMLNNGQRIKYGYGISNEESLDQRQYYHNGGLAGYRTVIAVYPDQKMAFLIFGNSGESDVVGRLDQLAALFIPNKKAPATSRPARRDSSLALVTNKAEAEQLTGSYYAENGYHVRLSLIRNKLWIDEQLMLAKDSANHYSLLNNPAVKYVFTDDTHAALYSPVLDKPMLLEKLIPVAPSPKLVSKYAGTYTSPELDYSFQLTQKNGELYFSALHRASSKVEFFRKGQLLTGDETFSYLQPITGPNGRFLGFELSKGNSFHIKFYKQ